MHLEFALEPELVAAWSDPRDFRYFSIAALLVISFFSSIIVSTVEKGNIKSGLKYIPIFLFGSLAFYWIFMKILSVFFSGLTLA